MITNNLNKVAIIFLLLLLIFFSRNKNRESFYASKFSGRYCSGCGSKNRHKCSKCVNCGYCIPTNAPPSCVPGDVQGPYFREDCYHYEYMYPYSSKVGRHEGIISYFPNFGYYPHYIFDNYLNPYNYIYYTNKNYYDNRMNKLNKKIKKLNKKLKKKKKIL